MKVYVDDMLEKTIKVKYHVEDIIESFKFSTNIIWSLSGEVYLWSQLPKVLMFYGVTEGGRG